MKHRKLMNKKLRKLMEMIRIMQFKQKINKENKEKLLMVEKIMSENNF